MLSLFNLLVVSLLNCCRLYVVRGNPLSVLPQLIDEWKIDSLSFEVDTEPYAVRRDAQVSELCEKLRVDVTQYVSHTLYDYKRYLRIAFSFIYIRFPFFIFLGSILSANGGVPPLTYQKCLALMSKLGKPPKPRDAPTPQLLLDSGTFYMPKMLL